MSRLQFPGLNTDFTFNSSDLQANALQLIVNEMTVELSGYFSASPTMVALPKNTVYQDVIRWDVTLGNGSTSDASAESPVLYSNFPGIDNGNYVKDSRIGAELTIGKNKTYALIQLANHEVVSAANIGVPAVRNLVNARMRAAIREILRTLNTKLFSGSSMGSGNMVGFQTIFSGTSYAGIPHTLADYTGTQPNVDYYPDWRPLSGLGDLSDATLTLNDGYGVGGSLVVPTVYNVPSSNTSGSKVLDHFYAFDYQCRLKGRRYNLIVAHPALVEQFSQEYRTNLTYMISNGSVVQANEGMSVPRFKGVPIIEDVMAPQATAYFLNTEDMVISTMANNPGMPNLQTVDSQLNILVGELAKDTAMVSRFEALVLPQLVVWDTRGLNRLVIQD